jgi:hypothetical protein
MVLVNESFTFEWPLCGIAPDAVSADNGIACL